MTDETVGIVRAYHAAWTRHDFEQAAVLLSPALQVEVPINDYPSKDSFVHALAAFGSQVTRVDLLSELSAGAEAMQLYDMEVEGLGPMRIVEHFTIADGKIARLRQIHDTAALRTHVTPQRDYTRELLIEARRQQVFEALTTLEGLARWWTPLVEGAPAAGGEIAFAFEGIDETIVMRVDDARADSVSWTCLVHTGHPEWEGTTIVFQLHAPDDTTTLLEFRHHGLVPTLDCYLACEHGWHHFLNSLTGYVEHGEGTPFS